LPRKAAWVALFAGSFTAALFTSAWLELPYTNPEGIVGLASVERFHPGTDLVRFAYIVLVPFFLVALAARWLGAPSTPEVAASPESPGRRGALWIALALLLLVSGTFYYDRFPDPKEGGLAGLPLDTYHEGESLGSAVQILHGRAPYRDTVFLHGAGEDPVIAIGAFHLFGRSIASLRVLVAWLHVAVGGLFFLTVWRLFRGDPLRFLVALAALCLFRYVRPSDVGFVLQIRDAFLLGFLLCVIELAHWGRGKGRRAHGCVLLFGASALSASAWAFSVDRGLYLTLASLPALGAAVALWARAPRWPYVVATASGYLAGFLILGVAIQWQYGAMAHFLFGDVALYDSFVWARPYAFLRWKYIVPLLLIAANLCGLTHRLARAGAMRPYLAAHGVELTLALLSLLCFRNALVRSDVHHVWYSAAPAYLLSAFILVRYGLAHLAPRSLRVIAALLVALFVGGYARSMPSDWGRLPEPVSDEALVPEAYREAVGYLRANLQPDDEFYTLTNEGVWYYFVDRPAPNRYPVLLFAPAPHQQREIVTHWETHDVPYIVYRTSHLANQIDGVPSSRRAPIVFDYVHEHYAPHKTFGEAEIWRRRD